MGALYLSELIKITLACQGVGEALGVASFEMNDAATWIKVIGKVDPCMKVCLLAVPHFDGGKPMGSVIGKEELVSTGKNLFCKKIILWTNNSIGH